MGEATRILLLDAAGAAVEAFLHDEIADQHIADWRSSWKPEIDARRQDLIARNVPLQEWPQSLHWDWARKTESRSGQLAFQGFAIVCNGVTQGMMQVDLRRAARIDGQVGKPLVYVQYLECAPWNRPDCGQAKRFRGVGRGLLAEAVRLSVREEFKGRTGLHSLPQADTFYRQWGMTDFGPDPRQYGLRYFEFSPDAASTFLSP